MISFRRVRPGALVVAVVSVMVVVAHWTDEVVQCRQHAECQVVTAIQPLPLLSPLNLAAPHVDLALQRKRRFARH